MDPGVRCHGMKALTGYLWFKYERGDFNSSFAAKKQNTSELKSTQLEGPSHTSSDLVINNFYHADSKSSMLHAHSPIEPATSRSSSGHCLPSYSSH